MTEYYYNTICSFRWWNIFDGKIPDYNCKDFYTDYMLEPVKAANSFNPSTETYVGMLFLIAASILGIAIVELLHNKTDWYITPLVNRVVKRYRYTLERNRLATMQGHP